jgi:CDP-paratose 2-epimerase
MRILVTGGAGFVGSHVSIRLRQEAVGEVVALDNLRRRGSELAISRLEVGGVEFRHGDIRNPTDLEAVGPFDLLIECSAEPSVQAGYGESPAYVVDTNLVGTLHCLEAARRCGGDLVFLSTSRVYPIAGLRALPLEQLASRFELVPGSSGEGWSADGIAADFPLGGSRSMYGASKLCSELLIEEYRAMYGLRAVINRCGVLSGPWQMGKVDQGFFVLWVVRHLYGGALDYIGFGGKGLQVRDVLHIEDLFKLLIIQLQDMDRHDGQVYNVGGGAERSVSLAELTELCRRQFPTSTPIGSRAEAHPADVPYYVTDNAAVSEATGWSPQVSLETLVTEVAAWLRANRDSLQGVLG